jgi:hypothetical protein
MARIGRKTATLDRFHERARGAESPIEKLEEFFGELKVQWGRRTCPLLRGEEMRAMDFVGKEEAYPAKRQNQQRHIGRRSRSKVPMSGFMLLMAIVIVMVAARVISLRR